MSAPARSMQLRLARLLRKRKVTMLPSSHKVSKPRATSEQRAHLLTKIFRSFSCHDSYTRAVVRHPRRCVLAEALDTLVIPERALLPHVLTYCLRALSGPPLPPEYAGLTLGYMSLDETQLRVLAVSGTEKQRKYALKIQPIRKNGHLLLVRNYSVCPP